MNPFNLLSAGNTIAIIIAIPIILILLFLGYYGGEWILNGFKDVEESKLKERKPMQVVLITIVGVVALILFLSLFRGCEGEMNDADIHRP